MNRLTYRTLLLAAALLVPGFATAGPASEAPADPASEAPAGPASEAPADPASEAPAPGTTLVDSKTGITLAYIPAGTFTMGSPAAEEGRRDDETQHKVTLSKPFWMGTTEVTNAQYRRFVEATGHREPKFWSEPGANRPNQPVVGVSWNDAEAYGNWAEMSLPTEAQWEYAARAGTTTRSWSGDSWMDIDRVGWTDGNSGMALHDVGEKPANPWGLHDVLGNASEWVWDWYSAYYYVESPPTDPTGPVFPSYMLGGARVDRGGDWYLGVRSVASRGNAEPWGRFSNTGFRVVKAIP